MGALSEAKVRATIAVTDMQRARSFYVDTLGMKEVETYADIAAVYSSGGADLNVYPSQYAGTCQSTAATFEVSDLDAAMAELRAKGVTFEEYDMSDGPSTVNGVAEAAGIRSAWFKDPDGNVLAVVSTA